MELGALCGIAGSFKRRVRLYVVTYDLKKIVTIR